MARKRNVSVIQYSQGTDDGIPGIIVIDGNLPEKMGDELNVMVKNGRIHSQEDIVKFLEKSGKAILFDNYVRGDRIKYLNAEWATGC